MTLLRLEYMQIISGAAILLAAAVFTQFGNMNMQAIETVCFAVLISFVLISFYRDRRSQPRLLASVKASILYILLVSPIPLFLHPGEGLNPEWWGGCILLGYFILTGMRWNYLPFAIVFLVLGVLRGKQATIDVDAVAVWAFGVTMVSTGALDLFRSSRSTV